MSDILLTHHACAFKSYTEVNSMHAFNIFTIAKNAKLKMQL